MEPERRFLNITDCEIRSEEGETPRIKGYAARFNVLSSEMRDYRYGKFREQISPGAFGAALKGSDVRLLWNHNPERVLAREKNRTLRLWEDDKGLAFEASLPDTQEARDIGALIRGGFVDQMSFSFGVDPRGEDWKEGAEGKPAVRTITNFRELIDVSPVTFPAYPRTSVTARAIPGVDLEAIGRAVEARSAGLDVSEGDQEAVSAAVSALEALVATERQEPPEEESSDLGLRRRQLELAEAE